MDLFNSIQAGNYPSWNLMYQIMDPADVSMLDFDPLDVTKIWPENLYPLNPLGVMTLNRTVDNFFAENEQCAFSPSNIVPGVYYSNDKLLQARLFAYPDTQRYRLGGNYLLLPVNAPRVPYHNNNLDGVMNFVKRTSAINYFPSNLNGVSNAAPYPIPSDVITGQRTRQVIATQNNFEQAGVLYNSWPTDRQNRFLNRLIATLQPPVSVSTRNIIIGYWNQVDSNTLGPALQAAFPSI